MLGISSVPSNRKPYPILSDFRRYFWTYFLKVHPKKKSKSHSKYILSWACEEDNRHSFTPICIDLVRHLIVTGFKMTWSIITGHKSVKILPDHDVNIFLISSRTHSEPEWWVRKEIEPYLPLKMRVVEAIG